MVASHVIKLETIRVENERLRDENRRLQTELKSKYSIGNIIGSSNRMREVYQMVSQVCRSNATVLIRGESGTGKELVANSIHYNSQRAQHALRQGQLRRAAVQPDRKRALRPREGRLHRRHQAEDRQVRAGAPRHDLPRRDRVAQPGRPGQPAARPAGEGVRPRRRPAHHQGRRARHRGHQQEPRAGGRGRHASGAISTTG